jgi:LuxR family quorum sensing-dependent transcriptional regulator
MHEQLKQIVLRGHEAPANRLEKLEKVVRCSLVDYTAEVNRYGTPASILDALDQAIIKDTSLMVLGARRYGINVNEREALRIGKNVFIHKSVPDGWWDEFQALSRKADSPLIALARNCLAPFTWTECLRMFSPIGVDRWAYELALKYGMRDGLACPIGSRWVVVYWSRKVLSSTLSPQLRALLFMAANFAAIRLEQVVEPDPKRLGRQVSLTPRELSVLRLASNGHRTKRIAELLGLGEETVRSHIKKAQTKLGVKDRLHAVAEALRLHLIP